MYAVRQANHGPYLSAFFHGETRWTPTRSNALWTSKQHARRLAAEQRSKGFDVIVESINA